MAATLATTLGLTACGQAQPVRTPSPPSQFVDTRTLPLGQASAGDYDRVLETGLAGEPGIWRAPNVSTRVYRAPGGLGREAAGPENADVVQVEIGTHAGHCYIDDTRWRPARRAQI